MSLNKVEQQTFKNNLKSILAFVPRQQALALLELMHSEDAQSYARAIENVKAVIDSMPTSGQQDGKGDQAVAYLHYFGGVQKYYVTEKGEVDEDFGQQLSFGLINDGQWAELSYIDIEPLTHGGYELDLNWSPKTVADCRK